MLDGGARVFGYRFDGYWQDVGTIQSYWQANMDLLEDHPELDLYDRTGSSTPGPRSAHRPRSAPTAQVHRSLISHGCVINGTVVNSVLSPGVRVEVGAVVRDSIVMFDSVIRSGAVVDRSIIDKEVVVGPGAIVGEGPDFDTPNRQEPARLNTGITVVGKRAVIPRGVRIGRNVQDRRGRPLDGLHAPGGQERLDRSASARPARAADRRRGHVARGGASRDRSTSGCRGGRGRGRAAAATAIGRSGWRSADPAAARRPRRPATGRAHRAVDCRACLRGRCPAARPRRGLADELGLGRSSATSVTASRAGTSCSTAGAGSTSG